MGKIEKFEDMRIWQEARTLIKDIYKDFNNCNDWGFRDQIQRSAVSIMNNIAEGFERKSNKEFSRFLDISKGSSGEVRSMYYTAEDLGYVSADNAEIRRGQVLNISKGTGAFMRHLHNYNN